MRKLNYLALAALAATALNATAEDGNFANPSYEKDGTKYYVVKYDLESKSFAQSNDWEIDETFVFAVDVTGTPLEAALATPSRNPSVLGRGVAYDLFVTSAPEGTSGKVNIDGRLIQIEGNIYGMCVNFFQQHTSRYADAGFGPNGDYSDYECLHEGNIVTWNSNLFGFGWSADNAGAEWWDGVAAPMTESMAFECAPYTGTKTSEFYDYGSTTPADYCPFEGLDPAAYHQMCDSWAGYTAPEFAKDVIKSGVKGIVSDSETVKSVYFDLQGRQIEEPAKGLFIRQDIKADGSKASVKVVK